MISFSMAKTLGQSIENRKNWIIFPVVAVIMYILMFLWGQWIATIPPYIVTFDEEHDYGGYVYLYNNLNWYSNSYMEIESTRRCVRVNNKIYSLNLTVPMKFYKLNCSGAEGFVKVHQVVIP